MSQRYPGGVITKSPTAPTQSAASGVWTLEQVAEYVKSDTWPPNGPYYVEDVFSTYLYTGNNSTQTITNGIDLSGKGGLVWIKGRTAAVNHCLFDTQRGVSNYLNIDTAAQSLNTGYGVTSFSSTGFTVVDNSNGDYGVNGSGGTYGGFYVSWSFRKQPKFFDIVTFTGPTTGNTITVNHNLGSTPGCIIYRSIDSGDNWIVWHRGLATENYLKLESTTYAEDYNHAINATSTTFSLRAGYNIAANLGNCIAYVFAHDAGGFGQNNDQSIISCGSYTGNGTTPGPEINLGWEPQWVMIKRVGTSLSTGNWFMFDNMRGITVDQEPYLYANSTSSEFSPSDFLSPTAVGFNITTSATSVNASGDTYVYIAIRRPMKTPTDATKVFMPTVYTGTNVDNRLINTTIAPDFVMIRQRDDTVVSGMYTGARLTGQQYMITGSTTTPGTDADSFDAQFLSSEYGNAFSSMSGVWVGNDATRKFNYNTTSNNHIIHAFKRAPGFFDVVCYTGTGSARTVSHNLGVAPELMIVKRRSVARGWAVYDAINTATDYMSLNLSDAPAADSSYWNNTEPTSSVFTVNNAVAVNSSGDTYIALLFASCPGVSKVGSYTGNGTSQTINCGFTAGARYVLIKRTDTFGEWFVFDTARGITASSDPYLLLSSTVNETTNVDTIDPDNSGFVIVQDGNTELNVSSATYIYLAIA